MAQQRIKRQEIKELDQSKEKESTKVIFSGMELDFRGIRQKDASHLSNALSVQKSTQRALNAIMSSSFRHKTVSPRRQDLRQLGQQKMQRVNRIARKSPAFETMQQTMKEAAFTYNNPLNRGTSSSRHTIGQAQLSDRRWPLHHGITQAQIQEINCKDKSLTSLIKDVTADTQSMPRTRARTLRDEFSFKKLPSRLEAYSSIGKIRDGDKMEEQSMMLNQDSGVQSITYLNFNTVQNHPPRQQLLPQLNTTGFDADIYTPRQLIHAESIIKRHMQMSETQGGCQSRVSSFLQSPQHGQSKSILACTQRSAFNSSSRKMPIVVASQSQSSAEQNYEMTRAHDTFDRYNQTQQRAPSLTMQSSKPTTTHGLCSPKQQRHGSKLQKGNAQSPEDRSHGNGDRRKLSFFLERLQEQEEEDNELESISVDQILNEQATLFGKTTKTNSKLKNIKPVDKSASTTNEHKFAETMPTQQKLRQTLKKKMSTNKECILNEVTKNSKTMEAIVSVNEAADRFDKSRTNPNEQVNQYVKKFSELADLDNNYIHGNKKSALLAFADYIKSLAHKNLVKIQIKKGLTAASMNKGAKKQEVSKPTMNWFSSKTATDVPSVVESKLPIPKKENKFETLFQRASVIETCQVKNKADEVVQRIEYYQKFKKRNMSEEKKDDPALEYFKKCLENNSLLLPIFEKIYHKTLCLQNYMLSEGQCKGIAEACSYINYMLMNRVLFNNCGLNGNKMAIVLEGLANIKDFKSIIYKHNELNSLAIAKLEALFFRQIPNQLAELQIIDCKIHCAVVEQLCDLMLETHCQVRNFGLINVHHSESSFAKMCKYVQQSRRLRELNVSWQYLRPTSFYQLLDVIKLNRSLVSLNISWNRFTEEQPVVLTEAQINNGMTEVPLSNRNVEILNCLAEFIKYNTYLMHLDVSNCGLNMPALKYLSTFLNKAQALQCLHFSGNEGINEQTIDWIVERIRGQLKKPEVVIPPMTKEFAYREFDNHPMQKGGLIKLMRQQTTRQWFKKQPQESDAMLWKDIREGLKLREIVQSKRIHEQNMIDLRSTSKSTLIIQRHLGFKQLLPSSAKWQICTDEYSECWYCNYHILTLFVWVPRVSQMAENKDPEIRRYYESALDSLAESPTYKPITANGIPNILGSFTNWAYQPMRQIVPFVMQLDENPPDFIQMAVQQGKVRKQCTIGVDPLPLKHEELDSVEEIKNKYYLENWQRLILKPCLFANPHIANANQLTKLSLEIDPRQPIYFHAAFLKPGRTTYLIERQQPESMATQEELMLLLIASLEGETELVERQKSENFHVHQMLTRFRSDHVPQYANPRHHHTEFEDKHKSKAVFKNFSREEAQETFILASHDLKNVRFNDLGCNEGSQLDKLKKMIQQNMELIKEIHIHLLSKSSKHYPFISFQCFREHFLDRVRLPSTAYAKASYEAILSKIDYHTAQTERSPEKVFCRASLIEMFLRLAKCHYCDIVTERQLLAAEARGKTSVRMDIHNGFNAFIKSQLKTYFVDEELNRMTFREEKLQTQQIDLIYSMNQQGIQTVIKKYALSSAFWRPLGIHFLTPQDCVKLVKDDMRIDLSGKEIKAAYVLSQQLVHNEQDEKELKEYIELNYAEFIEFIARVSETWFEATEMEDNPLYRKIEYFLERMLGLVNLPLIQQETIINEFSDSDEEY